MKDFYKAWDYLNNHVIFRDSNGFNRFQECIDIEVVKVNPETKEIDDDKSKNTQTRVWLECGPYKKECMTHDIELDCGAKTFEKAIIKLAKLVKKEYGNKKKAALAKVYTKYPHCEVEIKTLKNNDKFINEKQLKL